MTTDAGGEWAKLCEENQEARDAYMDAQGLLTRKMAAVLRGDRSANPTDDDMKAADRAEERWTEVKARMKAFLQEHVR